MVWKGWGRKAEIVKSRNGVFIGCLIMDGDGWVAAWVDDADLAGFLDVLGDDRSLNQLNWEGCSARGLSGPQKLPND